MTPKKISAPVLRNYGSPYFRIQVPSNYFTSEFEMHYHTNLFNKFSGNPFASGLQSFDRVLGTAFDYMKIVENYFYTLKQDRYHAVWLNRSLLNFKSKVDQRLKNVFYDVDDATWMADGAHAFEYYCRNGLAVLAGNNFIAERASKYTNRVVIVPTSVDTEKYYRIPHRDNNTFVVGWIGSSSGFSYLTMIEKPLKFFFESHKDARLCIIADRFPHELKTISSYIDFLPWSIQHDAQLINRFSVGIMPLKDTAWEHGKCSFKMLQYMACEIPVVVSAVGMNNDVMALQHESGFFGASLKNTTDWDNALAYYYSLSKSTRELQGANGRNVIKKNYDAQLISKSLMDLFNQYL